MTSNSFFKWAKNFGWTLQKMRSYDHKVYEKVLDAMANANHTQWNFRLKNKQKQKLHLWDQLTLGRLEIPSICIGSLT